MVKVKKTPEFQNWLLGLRAKEQAQIGCRLMRIQDFGHFGDYKPLRGCAAPMFELRWANGWRIYFYREEQSIVLLLLGGKKNDQKKDIKKAETLYRKYANFRK